MKLCETETRIGNRLFGFFNCGAELAIPLKPVGNLPVPATGSIAVSRIPERNPVLPARPAVPAVREEPELDLSGKRIVVDGREVKIPLGVSRRITTEAVRTLAKLCSQRDLFVARGSTWKKLEDKEILAMDDRQRFKSEEKPAPAPEPNHVEYRSAPHWWGD